MRKYTSAARMPLWKWILCLLGGLLIFTILQGLAMSIPDRMPWPLLCLSYLAAGGLVLFLYAVWVNLTERRPVLELPMEKSVVPHVFPVDAKVTRSITLKDLIKSGDPSPFPALTQIEVYGRVKDIGVEIS